ncbi:hypothetical protein D1007_08967 [Hordeum vulgare]|nr:hypothetical protein D1007_08967 [Hordeum vulgare]
MLIWVMAEATRIVLERDDNIFPENASARVEEPAPASDSFVDGVDDIVAKFDGVSVDSEKLANKHASDMGCFDGLDRTEHKFSTGDGVLMAKILSGQVDRRVRKFFKATQPESMDAHESVILPTFDPPDTPAHMGGVGHLVSVFLDLKNERFQLLDSYYRPTDETAVHLCQKMIDNIKKLWSDVSNDTETPINPLSIDHFPLDRIDVPQQHNNVDYGFFMLTNVNSFHQGVLENYTHEDISDIRKTWLYTIATSNLFEKDFMELFGYHTWSAAPKTHCTQKVFAVQAEEISSDSDFEKIVGMRKSGKSAGATIDGRGGKNGVIARRKPTLESRNITSAKRVERLPLKWRSHFKRFVGFLDEVYGKGE